MQGLEYGNPVSEFGEIVRAGQAGGPLPTIATFFPVGERGASCRPCSAAQSAMNRSRRPMATGSNFFPSVQCFSHWLSWGQTRPQTAGSRFSLLMISSALSNSPALIAWMNRGIGTLTGQPVTHFGSLQFRHRPASVRAISGV